MMRTLLLTIALLLVCSCGSKRFGDEYYEEDVAEENAENNMVYVCDGPYVVAFHSDPDCDGLQRCSGAVEEMTREEAEGDGLRECRMCW